jgi:tRNA (Thr-GGU) A37 N-methylase
MLDGTPLLDIKPYIPEFDIFIFIKQVGIRNGIIHDQYQSNTAFTTFANYYRSG